MSQALTTATVFHKGTGLMVTTKATKSGSSQVQKRMTRAEFSEAMGLDKSHADFNRMYLDHIKGHDAVAVAHLERARQMGLCFDNVRETLDKDGNLKRVAITMSQAPKGTKSTKEELSETRKQLNEALAQMEAMKAMVEDLQKSKASK